MIGKFKPIKKVWVTDEPLPTHINRYYCYINKLLLRNLMWCLVGHANDDIKNPDEPSLPSARSKQVQLKGSVISQNKSQCNVLSSFQKFHFYLCLTIQLFLRDDDNIDSIVWLNRLFSDGPKLSSRKVFEISKQICKEHSLKHVTYNSFVLPTSALIELNSQNSLWHYSLDWLTIIISIIIIIIIIRFKIISNSVCCCCWTLLSSKVLQTFLCVPFHTVNKNQYPQKIQSDFKYDLTQY